MELQVQGHNFDLDTPTRDHITRKLDRIERHMPSARAAVIVIDHDGARRQDQKFSAQITLNIDGTVLRSQERGITPSAAVDAAVETLDRRVRQFKTRVVRGEWAKHSGASIRYAPSVAQAQMVVEPAAMETSGGKVVRVKHFDIQPMSVDEAIFQMEMLGHGFFLFLNSEDKRYNLLYRRNDGDYGLIVPSGG